MPQTENEKKELLEVCEDKDEEIEANAAENEDLDKDFKALEVQ